MSLSGTEMGEITLGKVNAENVLNLIEEYTEGKLPTSNIILSDKTEAPLNDLLAYQKRIVLQNCGKIDPLSIEEYESCGGYQALKSSYLKSRRNNQYSQDIKLKGTRWSRISNWTEMVSCCLGKE